MRHADETLPSRFLPGDREVLTGCGGDNTSDSASAATSLSVADVDPGAYIVSVGDSENPAVGKYYAAPDGSRHLVIADADDKATLIYRRAKGGNWVAAPASTDAVSVKLLRADPVPAAIVEMISVAGMYTTALPSGAAARFTITPEGKVTPGDSACQLSGIVGAHGMPNTLSLKLSAADCGTLPANVNGILAVDTDYRPAAFRLIADDGNRIVDLWAYRD